MRSMLMYFQLRQHLEKYVNKLTRRAEIISTEDNDKHTSL